MALDDALALLAKDFYNLSGGPGTPSDDEVWLLPEEEEDAATSTGKHFKEERERPETARFGSPFNFPFSSSSSSSWDGSSQSLDAAAEVFPPLEGPITQRSGSLAEEPAFSEVMADVATSGEALSSEQLSALINVLQEKRETALTMERGRTGSPRKLIEKGKLIFFLSTFRFQHVRDMLQARLLFWLPCLSAKAFSDFLAFMTECSKVSQHSCSFAAFSPDIGGSGGDQSYYPYHLENFLTSANFQLASQPPANMLQKWLKMGCGGSLMTVCLRIKLSRFCHFVWTSLLFYLPRSNG